MLQTKTLSIGKTNFKLKIIRELDQALDLQIKSSCWEGKADGKTELGKVMDISLSF